MPEPDFSSRPEEYWFHVSPQEALPLAGEVGLPIDLERVSRFFLVTAGNAGAGSRQLLSEQLIEHPPIFSDVRQFLGISDKRAYLDLSYIASRLPHPRDRTALCGCQPWNLSRHPLPFFTAMLNGARGNDVKIRAALMLADYLLKHGLQEAAASFAEMPIDVLTLIYSRLISPKEYQQRAAKRRGHGCEAALAALLSSLGLEVLPQDKAANPMGARDPNVDLLSMDIVDRNAGHTHSFDMVLMHEGRARVLIQSLIHTSDPGQYGVNKSDETVQIMERIRRWREMNPLHPIELWVLVDGVGFCENKPDTINKLLREADYFFQLKTLFKAALRAHALGLTRISGIQFCDAYSDDQKAQLRRLYCAEEIRPWQADQGHGPAQRAIGAGNATLLI